MIWEGQHWHTKSHIQQFQTNKALINRELSLWLVKSKNLMILMAMWTVKLKKAGTKNIKYKGYSKTRWVFTEWFRVHVCRTQSLANPPTGQSYSKVHLILPCLVSYLERFLWNKCNWVTFTISPPPSLSHTHSLTHSFLFFKKYTFRMEFCCHTIYYQSRITAGLFC